MSRTEESSPPSDVCLLLRAYAEQRWLSREVIPVIRQLETPELLPEEQYGAAMAYMEVIWLEAQQRAQETDSAYAALIGPSGSDCPLSEKARRYHQTVYHLREVVARRVEPLMAADRQVPTVLQL